MLALVEPEDLLKYGLIPELVGRMPVVATLDSLNEDALVDILTKPKNAITRQYQRFFDMENVRLNFEPEALRAIARIALSRGTGARGLRAVLEDAMLDIMYDIPSQMDVESVAISEEVIVNKATPLISYRPEKRKKEA
jgi:ATP-dependent Clp protease ATP-binding subunit ClpX